MGGRGLPGFMAGSGLIATPLLLHSLLSYIAIPQEFSTQQLPRAHCTIAQLHSLHVKDKNHSEGRGLVAYIGFKYCTRIAKVFQKYCTIIEKVLHKWLNVHSAWCSDASSVSDGTRH